MTLEIFLLLSSTLTAANAPVLLRSTPSISRSARLCFSEILDNNGIVGLQLQNKLFPSNAQSVTAYDAIDDDLCVYLAADGSVILSRVELNIPDQYASGVTDAYGDGVPVYDLRSHNINLSSFRDSVKAPTLSFCAMLMETPLQLDDGNITVRAIQKVYSTDPADTPAAITQVVGYDLYVIDDITGDVTGYSFNIDGQLDANRTADPSALNETVSITINPVNDAPYVTGTLCGSQSGEEDTESHPSSLTSPPTSPMLMVTHSMFSISTWSITARVLSLKIKTAIGLSLLRMT